jgi:hypothetical protein
MIHELLSLLSFLIGAHAQVTCNDVKALYVSAECCDADPAQAVPGCGTAFELVNTAFVDDAQAILDAMTTAVTTENVGYEGVYKPTAMLIASKDGEHIVSAAGIADYDTNEPFTVDTPYGIFSGGKAIGNLMMAMAIDKGYLTGVSQPLKEVFPGFDKTLKQVIPISNLKVAELGITIDDLKDGAVHTLASGDEIQMLHPSAVPPSVAYPTDADCDTGNIPVLFEYTENPGKWGEENWFGVKVDGTLVAEAGCDLDDDGCRIDWVPSYADKDKFYLGATYGPGSGYETPGPSVFTTTVCIPSGKTFTVEMRDSYGDGWNSNFLNVRTTLARGGRMSCNLPGLTLTSAAGTEYTEVGTFDPANFESCPPLQAPYGVMVHKRTRDPTVLDLVREAMGGHNSKNPPSNTIYNGWTNDMFSTYMHEQHIPDATPVDTTTSSRFASVDVGASMTKAARFESMFQNWTGLLYYETGTFEYGSGTESFAGPFLEYVINAKDGTDKPLDEIYNAWFAELGLSAKIHFYGKNDMDEHYKLKSHARAKQGGQPCTQYYANDANDVLRLARTNMSDPTSRPYTIPDGTTGYMRSRHDIYDPDGIPATGYAMYASPRSLATLWGAIGNKGMADGGVRMVNKSTYFQVFDMVHRDIVYGYDDNNAAYGNVDVLELEYQLGPGKMPDLFQFSGVMSVIGTVDGPTFDAVQPGTAVYLRDLKRSGFDPGIKTWAGATGTKFYIADDGSLVARFAANTALPMGTIQTWAPESEGKFAHVFKKTKLTM